jgi:hypothetical protein
MATEGGPNIITDGLVLALDAANTKSYPRTGTTWKDLSGNGNNGTLINGPTFDSGNLGSIVFDGVDDSGQLQFQFSNTYTININIKFTGLITGNRAIVDLGSITPSVRLYLQSSKIKIQHAIGFAATGLLTTQNVPTNVWKNYTITGNGSFCQIFEDGVLNNSGDVTRSPEIDLRQMGIADKPIGSSSAISPLNCNISLLQIYNKALTAQEILQNYNATKLRYGL